MIKTKDSKNSNTSTDARMPSYSFLLKKKEKPYADYVHRVTALREPAPAVGCAVQSL